MKNQTLPFLLSAMPCCLSLGVVLLAAGEAVKAADLRVGTAAVNINPPLGAPMAGYYFERGAEGVLDDLYAKAAVLDDGQTKVAFVVCDLIGFPRNLVVEARKQIEAETGIPGDHVMISVTHSHTGPVIPSDSAMDELDGGTNALAIAYARKLPGRVAQAVAKAHAKLAPTQVSYARGSEDRMAFNRRYWMRDGTVGWNPGKLNPDIIRPVGPIDPEVGVVYFESSERAPQLTYVNYAMHPDTTGGARLSADYPGALARRLADYRGPEMLTLFANGTCGNLNHLNVRWAGQQGGTNEANRLGTILAGDVFKAYMELKPVTNTTLRSRSELVDLPVTPVTEKDIAEARAIAQRGTQSKFMDLVRAYQVLDVAQLGGKPVTAEVQVVALGSDLAWVSLPGEIFVELGLSIKAASPFKQTHIAELANGSIDYIPNRSAYAEGNYEVVSARCAAGAGERLVATALKLLNELKP